MIYIRSFLYMLGMWLFTPIFTTLILFTFPLPRRTRYILITGWARSMLWWLRVTCGLRYRVLGRENIPEQPCVILCKHQSAWETLALQQIFPPQVWVLKRELLFIPFFGWGLALTSPIAINRAAGREALKQLVAKGKERLKQGFFVVIFPEGTRVAPGTTGKYHIGGAWLAAQTKTPVVPVAHNAGEYWGKNSFLKRPGTITLSIGRPIDTNGIKADELNQRVEAWIEKEMPLLDRK